MAGSSLRFAFSSEKKNQTSFEKNKADWVEASAVKKSTDGLSWSTYGKEVSSWTANLP